MEKDNYYSEERSLPGETQTSAGRPPRKGRQTSAGQARRRQRIIDYIKEKESVKGTEICRDLAMSRSSLSDDIRSINTGGEIISSPKRGIYVIAEEVRNTNNPYSRIDRQAVRKWMILLSLFKEDRTLEQIAAFLAKKGMSCAQSVLYEDLKVLMQERLIERRTRGKQRYYHSESLYETDLREIEKYEANKAGNSARVDISTCERIDLKIKHSVPGYQRRTKREGVRRSGKHNDLTEEEVRMLQDLDRYPYKEKGLLVTFRTNAGREVTREICVGIIVYVVETARIYLMGENSWQGQEDTRQEPADAPKGKEIPQQRPDGAGKREGGAAVQHKNYVIIPLDQVLSVSEGGRVNTCYRSPEYYRICREMFQISAEEPMNVRVRFENYPFIRDKIERLCSSRETAHMEIADDEIVFTDIVRGKGALARYLRRFGRSAIVEEPPQLREDLISSSRKILRLYEGSGGEPSHLPPESPGAGQS